MAMACNEEARRRVGVFLQDHLRGQLAALQPCEGERHVCLIASHLIKRAWELVNKPNL